MTVKLNLFDLNLLRALDGLLSERSVTRAAERVRVTQQAMSGSLKRLKEHFSDELLVRIGTHMELTPLGSALVNPVREAILQIGMALDTTVDFNPDTTKRRFRVAMSDYVVLAIMPLLMRRVLAATPHMICDIDPGDGGGFAGLESGDLDISIYPAFAREHVADLPDGVRHLPLFKDDFVCVVDPSINAFDDLTLARYLDLPHVSVRMGHGQLTLIEDAWAMNRISPRVAVTTTSYSNALFMVAGTPLIATVQRRLAKALSSHLPIRLLECPISIHPLHQELNWHSRNDDDQAHRYLRGQLLRAAQDMDTPTGF